MTYFDPEQHAVENGGFTQVDFEYASHRLTEELVKNWVQKCVIWPGKDGALYLAKPLPEPARFFVFHEWDILRWGPKWPDGTRSADIFELRFNRAEDVTIMNHIGHEIVAGVNPEALQRTLVADASLQEQLGLNRPTETDGDILGQALIDLFEQ